MPVNNKARRIDSVLANGLESLPGLTGMMAVLATAQPSARAWRSACRAGRAWRTSSASRPMTAAQLTQGLPANEIALLNANGGMLLKKTPLWYYVLREAAVLEGGNQLGPVGARIVADTFIRMLKRDAELLSERERRVHAVPAISDGRRFHVRGPDDLCGGDPAVTVEA